MDTGLKTSGGEGGILGPPFLLSAWDPYIYVIIGCFPSGYKVFQS
jgi:hypothetical protein